LPALGDVGISLGATVNLITSVVGATVRRKTLGRAEALRRAMLGMTYRSGEVDRNGRNTLKS
jgi:hypothetical protein